MKRFGLLIEALLVAGALVLGVRLAMPRQLPVAVARSAAQPAVAAAPPAAAEQRPAAGAEPAAVARLFGWRPPAPAVVAAPPALPPPAEPAPIVAGWLAPLGRAADSGGRRIYLFKDERTGRIVRALAAAEPGPAGTTAQAAAPTSDTGAEALPWRVLSAADDVYLLEHAGQRYLVDASAQ